MLEPEMAKLLRDYNLPPAVFQHAIEFKGRRMKIDFAYPDLMIAIEVDGYVTHRIVDELQDDVERQTLLVEAGWIVIRFSWRHITGAPDHVAERLRRVLGGSA
ncbi:MAG: endonuclease domain-containing protein [Actinomycetota bacterium]